jgi:hypothetical protein
MGLRLLAFCCTLTAGSSTAFAQGEGRPAPPSHEQAFAPAPPPVEVVSSHASAAVILRRTVVPAPAPPPIAPPAPPPPRVTRPAAKGDLRRCNADADCVIYFQTSACIARIRSP